MRKTSLSAVIVAALLSLYMPAKADAAEEFVCYHKDISYSEEFLLKGQEAEKKGDLSRALLYYQGASECIKSGEHEKRIERVVDKMVAGAKKRGDNYSGGAYKTVFDDNCPASGQTWGMGKVWFTPDVDVACIWGMKGLRVELKKNVGVFDIYEEAGYYARADLAMMNWIKSAPENINVFSVVLTHFRNSNKKSDKKRTLSGYKGESLVAGYIEELKKISIKNARRILEKENAIFNKKKIETAQESIRLISLARRWLSFMAQENDREIIKRAEIRGDRLLRNRKEPSALKKAVEYYGLARLPKKNIKARKRADKLGDMYAGQKKWEKAARYFAISGNRPRQREAEKHFEQ